MNKFENELAAVAIAKNESPYINEWLEYHFGLGVEKFYIYDNNDSTDERNKFKEVLKPWISKGIVELIDFPGYLQQMPAYNHAIQHFRFRCRYMIVIDVDEFIYPKNGRDLLDLINEVFECGNNIGGFAINWRMFGANGHEKKTSEDVLERFTMHAEEEFIRHKVIKTIVNPRRVRCFTNPHFAKYFTGCGCIDAQKNTVPQGQNPDGTVEKIQLNHYYLKSREEFFEKRQRGRADYPKDYSIEQFEAQDHNIVEDTGARDLYRKMKTEVQIKIQHTNAIGERIVAQNLNDMLEPATKIDPSDDVFIGQTERYLICFFSAKKSTLLDEKSRLDLENISLEFLFQSMEISELEPWEALLIIDALPEIMETNLPSAKKIFESCKEVLPTLIDIANENIDWEVFNHLKYLERSWFNEKII